MSTFVLHFPDREFSHHFTGSRQVLVQTRQKSSYKHGKNQKQFQLLRMSHYATPMIKVNKKVKMNL